ncbi:MAG: hypothetical protein LBR32_09870 [Propionibacteriaceae bacterium]|jgi:ABC-type Na+ efflux pump permease subunit|nr:hypothetical protein [Propionibacteriaceae bacterium]
MPPAKTITGTQVAKVICVVAFAVSLTMFLLAQFHVVDDSSQTLFIVFMPVSAACLAALEAGDRRARPGSR